MRFRIAAFWAVAGLFVSIVPAFAGDSLYSQFSRKGTVKVFVQDPSDTSSNKKVDPATLKKQIEETLTARKSLKFELAPTREAADVAIETEVVEYYWTDHDPVDVLFPAAAAAYDVMNDEHYARVQANMSVKDTKAGRPLWKDKMMGTVTGGKMTEAEGPRLAGEKMAQGFVVDAFGKKKGRR